MSRERSVIVCDDELELAQELGEFFESNGWRVLVVGSCTEVQKALVGGYAPSCLITDLRLGPTDGGALVRYACQLPASLKPQITVVITGHATDPASVGKFGADLLYFKPVDPFVVLEEVEALLVGPAAVASR